MFTVAVKISAVLASAGAAAAMLAGCSGDAESPAASDCKPVHDNLTTISPRKLTIGVIDIPPFSTYNTGSPDGIDVSIINKVAADECLEPIYRQVTYADAMQSINGGSVDVAVGSISVTEMRLTAVDFSSSTYLDGMGIASTTGAQTVADLEKAGTVGTVEGYLWVDDLKKILGDRLKTYPSSVQLKADFEAGRLSADVDAYGVLVLQFKDVPGVQVSLANEKPDPRVQAIVQAPEAAFPYTKGNTSLAAALNAGIERQRRNGTIRTLIVDAGLAPKLADVGQQQYVVPASR